MDYQYRITLVQECLQKTFLETETTISRLQETAKDIVFYVRNKGGIVFTAGNGGSHSLAEHMTGELIWRLDKDRKLKIPSVCLTSNSSVNTAISNDIGYEYSPAIHQWPFSYYQTEQTHILIGFTTSGESQNIKELFGDWDKERPCPCYRVLFIGKKKTHMAADEIFDVRNVYKEELPTDVIQEIQTTYMHLLCNMIWKELQNHEG